LTRRKSTDRAETTGKKSEPCEKRSEIEEKLRWKGQPKSSLTVTQSEEGASSKVDEEERIRDLAQRAPAGEKGRSTPQRRKKSGAMVASGD